MWVEALTISIIGGMAISSIFKLPADSAEKIVLALGSALGGYLTKTVVDMIKNKSTGGNNG